MNWISVKERMPDEGLAVLASSRKTEGIYRVFREDGVWNFLPCSCCQPLIYDFEYWMPLPEAPKDEE